MYGARINLFSLLSHDIDVLTRLLPIRFIYCAIHYILNILYYFISLSFSLSIENSLLLFDKHILCMNKQRERNKGSLKKKSYFMDSYHLLNENTSTHSLFRVSHEKNYKWELKKNVEISFKYWVNFEFCYILTVLRRYKTLLMTICHVHLEEFKQ